MLTEELEKEADALVWTAHQQYGVDGLLEALARLVRSEPADMDSPEKDAKLTDLTYRIDTLAEEYRLLTR